MSTDTSQIVGSLFPTADNDTEIPFSVFINDLVDKYKHDRVAIKTITRVFFNQVVETYGICLLYTSDAADE